MGVGAAREVVGTTVAAGDGEKVPDVQPATAAAMMQRRDRAMTRISIQK
jgi:hypothetical protein